MAKVLINDQYLNDIAAAIRYKKGVSTKYKPKNMATAIRSITTSSGSGSVAPESLYENTHSMTSANFASGRVTAAFAGSTALTEVSATTTDIPMPYAFAYCSNLTTFTSTGSGNTIPSITVSEGMFLNCSSLVNLTNDRGYPKTYADIIGGRAFEGCTSLERIYANFYYYPDYFDNVFKDCSNLTRIDTRDLPENCDLYTLFGTGITKLKTVVIRNSGTSLKKIIWSGELPNDLYFYVPSTRYDSVVSGSSIPSQQIRKIEDYPELDA